MSVKSLFSDERAWLLPANPLPLQVFQAVSDGEGGVAMGWGTSNIPTSQSLSVPYTAAIPGGVTNTVVVVFQMTGLFANATMIAVQNCELLVPTGSHSGFTMAPQVVDPSLTPFFPSQPVIIGRVLITDTSSLQTYQATVQLDTGGNFLINNDAGTAFTPLNTVVPWPSSSVPSNANAFLGSWLTSL